MGHQARELLQTCTTLLRGSLSGFTRKCNFDDDLDLQLKCEALEPFAEGLDATARMIYEGESSVLIPWKNHWLLGLSLSVSDAAESPVAVIIFVGNNMPRFDSHMRGMIDGFRCSLATLLNCQRTEEVAAANKSGSKDILTVCSHCKLIKNDTNEWVSWDNYPTFSGRHKLSHTICEACSILHYDEPSFERAKLAPTNLPHESALH